MVIPFCRSFRFYQPPGVSMTYENGKPATRTVTSVIALGYLYWRAFKYFNKAQINTTGRPCSTLSTARDSASSRSNYACTRNTHK